MCMCTHTTPQAHPHLVMYAYLHIHTYMHTNAFHTYMYMYMYKHVHMYTHMQACTHLLLQVVLSVVNRHGVIVPSKTMNESLGMGGNTGGRGTKMSQVS